MRPDDHAAIVGMDPLPYHRTVGAIGIVFATTPTVIVPRPDAKSERANLNACTIRIHASVNLSRGGNRPNEQRAVPVKALEDVLRGIPINQSKSPRPIVSSCFGWFTQRRL
jgi:hypothetical protein